MKGDTDLTRRQRRRERDRRPHCDHHHLETRANGGGNDRSNLLTIKIEKHKAWHKLFGDLNIDDVIDVLERLKKMKARQHEPPRFKKGEGR